MRCAILLLLILPVEIVELSNLTYALSRYFLLSSSEAYLSSYSWISCQISSLFYLLVGIKSILRNINKDIRNVEGMIFEHEN